VNPLVASNGEERDTTDLQPRDRSQGVLISGLALVMSLTAGEGQPGHPKVLLWMPRASEIPGGHLVQMRATAESLRKLGVDARTYEAPDPDLTGVDVVHGFGLVPRELRATRRLGSRIVLSPIYWSRSYRLESDSESISARTRTRLRSAAVLTKAALLGPDALARKAAVYSDAGLVATFESADLLLPNSAAEAHAVQNELSVTTPMQVVPNAVDEELLGLDEQPEAERCTVLCLGRLEPHKNQLSVIRALSGTGLPVEIVGPVHPDHQAYEAACRESAGPNIRFFGSVKYGEPEHTQALRRARVSVLASWFETTGLASLEAAATGARVVTTERGFAREYFGESALYCDPGSEASIRSAVLSAWEQPHDGRLRKRIAEQFTWRHTAEATLAGYRAVLDHDYSRLRKSLSQEAGS
jgi:glycosyltransferase involved in cell wall biosynthesis